MRGGHCIRILYGEAIEYYSLYGQAICIYIHYVYKGFLSGVAIT